MTGRRQQIKYLQVHVKHKKGEEACTKYTYIKEERAKRKKMEKVKNKGKRNISLRKYSEETRGQYYNVSAYSATSVECLRETPINRILRGASFILNPMSWLHLNRTSD